MLEKIMLIGFPIAVAFFALGIMNVETNKTIGVIGFIGFAGTVITILFLGFIGIKIIFKKRIKHAAMVLNNTFPGIYIDETGIESKEYWGLPYPEYEIESSLIIPYQDSRAVTSFISHSERYGGKTRRTYMCQTLYKMQQRKLPEFKYDKNFGKPADFTQIVLPEQSVITGRNLYVKKPEDAASFFNNGFSGFIIENNYNSFNISYMDGRIVIEDNSRRGMPKDMLAYTADCMKIIEYLYSKN
ncbi:hypothetical protein AAIR98_000413 [Elusimicrobium simillimum]|uniref:hypothetical protein n=1 Tax=Elusimicrobium simillimum TaxID=3143438 RepID=UPI003C6EB61B